MTMNTNATAPAAGAAPPNTARASPKTKEHKGARPPHPGPTLKG